MLMKVEYTDGDINLLSVAQACRETPHANYFTMSKYGSFCGTPGCALGNYAARRDLQDVVFLSASGQLHYIGTDGFEVPTSASLADLDDPPLCEHFGITSSEAIQLFGVFGYGRAQTHDEAATYIERFVAARVQARSMVAA